MENIEIILSHWLLEEKFDYTDRMIFRNINTEVILEHYILRNRRDVKHIFYEKFIIVV